MVSTGACHMAAWCMGRFPTLLGCDAPPGYALRRASITSCVAWKEHAAWRGRLPRSLRRDASSMNIGCLLLLNKAPNPLHNSCNIVSVILHQLYYLFVVG